MAGLQPLKGRLQTARHTTSRLLWRAMRRLTSQVFRRRSLHLDQEMGLGVTILGLVRVKQLRTTTTTIPRFLVQQDHLMRHPLEGRLTLLPPPMAAAHRLMHLGHLDAPQARQPRRMHPLLAHHLTRHPLEGRLTILPPPIVAAHHLMHLGHLDAPQAHQPRRMHPPLVHHLPLVPVRPTRLDLLDFLEGPIQALRLMRLHLDHHPLPTWHLLVHRERPLTHTQVLPHSLGMHQPTFQYRDIHPLHRHSLALHHLSLVQRRRSLVHLHRSQALHPRSLVGLTTITGIMDMDMAGTLAVDTHPLLGLPLMGVLLGSLVLVVDMVLHPPGLLSVSLVPISILAPRLHNSQILDRDSLRVVDGERLLEKNK
jgi:hypothetical protein